MTDSYELLISKLQAAKKSCVLKSEICHVVKKTAIGNLEASARVVAEATNSGVIVPNDDHDERKQNSHDVDVVERDGEINAGGDVLWIRGSR